MGLLFPSDFTSYMNAQFYTLKLIQLWRSQHMSTCLHPFPFRCFCMFRIFPTFPSLFRKASWIFHTSSGPAHAVNFPISKNCVMGLLSIGLILEFWFVALLNIENIVNYYRRSISCEKEAHKRKFLTDYIFPQWSLSIFSLFFFTRRTPDDFFIYP
jgi:hypothetical protein